MRVIFVEKRGGLVSDFSCVFLNFEIYGSFNGGSMLAFFYSYIDDM